MSEGDGTENKEKTSRLKRLFSPKNAYRLDIFIKLLEIVIIISAIGITYTLLSDIVIDTSFDLDYILFFMSLVGGAYILLILRDCILHKLVDINRITTLIYLIIFYFSLFAGIVVLKNFQPSPSIPDLKSGTVGLRTFGCCVTFRNISISYLDSKNVWQNVPFEVINDSSNWLLNQFKADSSHASASKFINDTTLAFQLNNSGAIFNTNASKVSKYFKGAKYVKVSTLLTLDSSYTNVEAFKYADIHICMNVPNTRQVHKEADELYLGFALPLENIYRAKFWIPALEWKPGNTYRDPVSLIKDNGFGEDLIVGEKYNFIAVRFNSLARIILRNSSNNGASILCEGRFGSE